MALPVLFAGEGWGEDGLTPPPLTPPSGGGGVADASQSHKACKNSSFAQSAL